MSPVTMIVGGVLAISWVSVFLYSKIFHKDETALERKIEHVIEQNLENVLNLPSGTLDDKLDFMVQPPEAEQDQNKENNKQGD